MSLRKILFINPSNQDDITQVKIFRIPPTNLGILAALTPSKYEVQAVDENVKSCTLQEDADLVAITAMTTQAPRAYELSKKYRERGIPVILGGIHASMRPEEASKYVDTIVVGEAEEIWPQILDDAEKGELKKSYQGSFANLDNVPAPRRNIFKESDYHIDTIQSTRGCPNNCNFCSVTNFNGAKYRYRPVSAVVDELVKMPRKNVFFIDDNIVGVGEKSANRALELFRAMKGLGKEWGAQTCIDIVDKKDVLDAAKKSGATYLFIGLESVEEETLKSMNKKINLRPSSRNYKEAIKILHDYGIMVIGGFILGNDTDTKDTFKRTIDFIHQSGLDVPQMTIMTPLPGTKLFDQYEKENRLLYTNFPEDWKRYNFLDVIVKPKNMTAGELKKGCLECYEEFSGLGASLGRAVRSLAKGGGVSGAVTAFFWHYHADKYIRKNMES